MRERIEEHVLEGMLEFLFLNFVFICYVFNDDYNDRVSPVFLSLEKLTKNLKPNCFLFGCFELLGVVNVFKFEAVF